MAISPEALLISAVVNKRDHVTVAARGITKRFFHAFPDEWIFIERYISLHKRVPSKTAFLQKFPKFRIKDVDDVEYFCEEVRKSHVNASLTTGLQDVIEAIDQGDTDGAVRLMHLRALDIETQMAGMSGDADIIEHWQDTFDEVMARVGRHNALGQAGLPTGFPTLDERTGGPQAGHVWIWAARLGQGKTWSLVRSAVAACFSGFNVQYDALEQTRNEIAMRVHSFASSEYGKDIFKNRDLAMGQNFSPRAYKEFLQSLRSDVDGKFHVADGSRGAIGLLTMASQVERNMPDAFYLDYIQILDTQDSKDDARQGIVALSKGIKQLAERYQIPFQVAAQLNREATNIKGPAGPEKIAEADAIGRDADAVITMRQLSPRIIVMKLAKFRHGRDGFTWYCKFLPNTGYFEEVTFDEAKDIMDEDKDEEEEDTTQFTPRKKGSFKQAAERKKKLVIINGAKSNKKIIVPKKKIVTPPKKKIVVRRSV